MQEANTAERTKWLYFRRVDLVFCFQPNQVTPQKECNSERQEEAKEEKDTSRLCKDIFKASTGAAALADGKRVTMQCPSCFGC